MKKTRTAFVTADREVVATMAPRDDLVWVECDALTERSEMGPFGDECDARAFVFRLVEQRFGFVSEIRRD